MGLPAVSRTYYADVNYELDCSSGANYTKSTLFALKASLIKTILVDNCAAVTAWTCEGSSDSVTAGMDGQDRWSSVFNASKIVHATAGVHSWIVLKHPTLSVWLCLDYLSSVTNRCNMIVAVNAFTGGTTSARPTSTSEVVFGSSTSGGMNTTDLAAPTKAWAHRVFDSTGLFYFFTTTTAHVIPNCMMFWPVDNQKSGDPQPWVIGFDYATGGALKGANSGSAGNWRNATTGFKARNFANSAWLGVVPGFWTAPTTILVPGGTIAGPDAATGEYMHASLYMLSTSSPTVKGRLADVYQTSVLRDGTVSPANASPTTHISIGNVWVPCSLLPRM